MVSPLLWVLVLAALVTSFLSAVIGMAGGITLLGVMTIILPPAQVVPLHGVVQLASNTTRTLVFLEHVRWRVFLVYSGPLLVGIAGAMQVWSGDKLEWFRPGIGLFILGFLAWRRRAPKLRSPGLWLYLPLGLVVGFLSIFVGATGPLIAPFFQRDDFEPSETVATQAACQGIAHLLKVPAFFVLGFGYAEHWQTLLALVAAVLVGTLAGKRFLARLSRRAFVFAFETALSLIAIYLIVSGLGLYS